MAISIHALREEGDSAVCTTTYPASSFLSTPSARRATTHHSCRSTHRCISIHALREEGDMAHRVRVTLFMEFLSTPSARRATFCCWVYPLMDLFLSTPSARRATWTLWRGQYHQPISIHALREEGDEREHIERRTQKYFYPRPPRGGRLSTAADTLFHQPISIHALREEGDPAGLVLPIPAVEFLSTPSARRATAKTETKSLFSNKLYNILHEFRRALIYNGSKNYPNHAK